MRRSSVLALTITLLPGCAASPSSPFDREPYCTRSAPVSARFGPGPTIDEVCPAIAARLCEQWARCGCHDTPGGLDTPRCLAETEATCTGFLANDEVRGALARGTLVWAGGEAAALLAALDAAVTDCDQVTLDASALAVGSLGHEVPCTDISGAFTECEDGRSCQVPGSRCRIDYVTAPTQGRGELCSSYTGCSPGLRCAVHCGGPVLEGVCLDALTMPSGQPCRGDGDCGSGFCHPDVWLEYVGHCAEPGTAARDTPCRDGRICAPGDVCVGVTATAGSLRTCRLPLRDAEPCWWDNECASALCLRWHEGAGTCLSPRPDGATCRQRRECASGACRGMRLVSLIECPDGGSDCGACPGRCVEQMRSVGWCGAGDEGAACDEADECHSGVCAGGRCAAEPPLFGSDGASCVTDWMCSSGLVCIGERCPECGSRCGSPLAFGQACARPAECATMSCIDGLCAEAVCSAHIDPTGHGSFWLAPPVLTPPRAAP